MLLLLLTANLSEAQTFAQIGSGTDTSASSLYGPLMRLSGTMSNRYSRSNIVFTQQELAAAGIAPGATITSIAFNKTNITNYPGYTFYHSMLAANSTVSPPLAGNTNWADIVSTHTRVYTDSNQSMPSISGWINFNFNAPLLYTGQNLSIATEQDWSIHQVFNAGEATNWQLTSGFEGQIVGNAGSSQPTTLNGTSTTHKRRPNVRIYYILPSGTDAAMLSFSSPANQVFANTQLPVSVALGNLATNTITSLSLNYQVNNGNIITENWTGNLTSNNNTIFQFNTLFTVPALPNFTLRAWISNVNGTGLDQVSSNDTVSAVFCTALSSPNYTIGGPGADFANLQAAFNQINCGGINGNVTLSIMQSDTGNFVLHNFTSNSGSILTITSGAPNVTLSNAGTSSLIHLNQVINVVVSNLVLVRTGAPTSAQDLLLLTNTNAVTVTGCTFQGFAGSATSANRLLHISGSTNTTVRANTFNNGFYGLYATGGINGGNTGLTCIDNSINNYTDIGINISGTNTNSSIINNLLTNTSATNTSGTGIQINTGRLVTVSENQILGNIGAVGIHLNDYTGDSLAPNVVINNVIAGDFSGSNPNAIRLSATGTGPLSDFVFVAHNSILIKTASTATFSSGVIQFFGGTVTSPTCNGIRFYNNVIQAVSTAASGNLPVNFRVFYFSNEYYLNGIFQSNHNHFEVPNPGSFAEQQTPQLAFPSLTNWRTVTARDLNSQSGNPLFSSINSNNLLPLGNSPLDNMATPLSNITTDVLGNTRSSTTPDIGAFEIQSITNSMVAVGIDTPMVRLAPNSSQQVRVRFLNAGTNVVTSLQLNYRYANNTIISETWTGSLSPGTTLSYTFNASFPVGSPIGRQSLSVWCALPNGQTDADISNDSLSETYCVALPAGVYTVGSPTSTFPSVADFTSFINCSGIYGAVTFDFEFPGNLYTGGNLILNSVPGSSPTNTITLNGQGDTIRFNASNLNRAILGIQETNNVIIRDFVLQSSNNSLGHGVYLLNAIDVKLIHNIIDLRNISSTIASNYTGILASGSQSAATATHFNNLFIDSNQILGAGQGIFLFGNPATSSQNILIKNNQIINFYNNGISLTNVDSAIIENNEISRPNRLSVAIFQGINLESNTQGMVVRNNRIHNSHGMATSLTTAAFGIRVASNGNLLKRNSIYNNLIYNFRSTGPQNGILLNNADNVDVYFNTISLDDATTSTGSAQGIYLQAWCRSIQLLNNNIVVTKGGSGEKQGIYLERDSNIFSSNHNNIYVNTTAGLGEIFRFGPVGYATLSNWQAAAAGLYDQNSVSDFPNFLNPTQGNFTPQNVTLNAAALPINGITADFAGVIRSTTPDIGALEFSPPGIDMRMVSLLSNPGNGCINSLQSIVRIRVNNIGTATVNNVPVFYKLNTNVVVVDTIPGNISPGATMDFTFSAPMQLRNGLDTLVIWLVQDGDLHPANDSLWFYFNNYQIAILDVPASFDFENGLFPNTLCSLAGDSARVTVLGNVGPNTPLNGSHSLFMLGSTTGLPWTPPLVSNWWTLNPNHLSTVNMYVRTDTLRRLELSFNLRQLFRSTASGNNFRLLVNDVERIALGLTSASLRSTNAAASAQSIPLVYDLSGDLGDTLKITFQASTRYNELNATPQAVLIDDIVIRQPVTIKFDSVTLVTNSCQPGPKTITALLDTLLPLANVHLSYSLNGSAPLTLAMSRTGIAGWTTILPSQPANTSVSYRVIAVDVAGNSDSSLLRTFIESPLTVDAGNDQTITIGNSATLIANKTGVYLTNTLMATLAGGIGLNNGAVSMNVQASKDILLDTITTRIYGTIGATAQVSVWHKQTPITGGPLNVTAPDWIQHVANYPVVVPTNGPSGSLPMTTFTIPPLAIPAGATYGLVVAVNGASLGFSNYSIVNPSFFYDGVMLIENGPNVGFGGNLPLLQAGTRQFNGRLGYRFPGNINWTVAGSPLILGVSDTLVVNPTQTTSYVVTASTSNCIRRDTVVVFLAPLNNPDLNIHRILAPDTGFLTISAPLNLRAVVKNVGDQPATGFTVQFTANGTTIASQTISNTLAVGDTALVNMTQLWSPTSGGYHFCASVSNSNDPNPTNNQLCQSTSISNVTSVFEAENDHRLLVRAYPNPVQEKLNLELLATKGDLKVVVADMTGKLMFENFLQAHLVEQTYQLDVSSRPMGVYHLRLIEKSGRQAIVRFIVNR